MRVPWPNGRRFAFTFCDDTDFATLGGVQPIYDWLESLGWRTTKLVWVFPKGDSKANIGDTCEDARYVEWLWSLQRKGFEIGLHNVSPSTASRDEIVRGLDRFEELFGSPPRLHCNHQWCVDNLYWGENRVTGWRRWLYNLYTRGSRRGVFAGHRRESPSFWGDLTRQRITYVRNFTFDDLNTLRSCPAMPYHDPDKPFVNFWFAATTASSPERFRQNFSRAKIDRLAAEGGLCIAYVHFGARFVVNGRIDPYFRETVEYIASLDPWVAPVSEALDWLRRGEDREARRLSPLGRQRLELRWILDRFAKKARA